MKKVFLGLSVALVAVLAGCGGTDNSGSTGTIELLDQYSIDLADNGFTPNYAEGIEATDVKWTFDSSSIAVNPAGAIIPSEVGTFNATAKLGSETVTTKLVVTNIYTGYSKISTVEDFKAMANGLNGKYYLTNDINFTNQTIDPISNWVTGASFNGVLDGRGYSISNLTLNAQSNKVLTNGETWGNSLFPKLGGEVRNLSIVNITSIGDGFIGTIAGENSGTIENCYVQGKVVGTKGWIYHTHSGGLVGINSGTISNCFAEVDVTGGYGIAGWNFGTGTASYAVDSLVNAELENGELGLSSAYAGSEDETAGMKPFVLSALLADSQLKDFNNFPGLSSSTIWTISNGTKPYLRNNAGTRPATI